MAKKTVAEVEPKKEVEVEVTAEPKPNNYILELMAIRRKANASK